MIDASDAREEMQRESRSTQTTSDAPAGAAAPGVGVRAFLRQKEQNAAGECEDAIGVNAGALTFAVADGATEAFDAGNWARRLAESWVRAEPPPLSLEDFQAWAREQGRQLQGSWQGRALPWYAEEKARRGSFAAFVGVRFERGAAGFTWRAVALGDSCLIQRRAGAILQALPLASHEGFNSTPLLVPSHEGVQASALSQAVVREGTAASGDVFLLLSDACAAWYLEQFAARSGACARFDSLLAASHNDALAELLRDERRAGRLKDDDVAALRIEFE